MENTQQRDLFKENFNYSSFIPMLIFILGTYIIYLILKKDYGQAFIFMLGAFLIYVYNNISSNLKNESMIFDEFLEDMASFFTFGVSIILFGIIFYKGDLTIMLAIFFFAICSILSAARSWVLKLKNTNGFPIALNGLFFPLVYYIYVFYL